MAYEIEHSERSNAREARAIAARTGIKCALMMVPFLFFLGLVFFVRWWFNYSTLVVLGSFVSFVFGLLAGFLTGQECGSGRFLAKSVWANPVLYLAAAPLGYCVFVLASELLDGSAHPPFFRLFLHAAQFVGPPMAVAWAGTMVGLWRGGIAWKRRRPGMCSVCGYDLTGNESGVCPECGTEIKEPNRQM